MRKKTWTAGFSLVELLVGVSLVSTLALTVGLAMYRTGRQVDVTREVLEHRHVENDIFRNITRQLRWASEIYYLSASQVTFKVATPNGTDMIGYYWLPNNRYLMRKMATGSDLLVTDNIYNFTVAADYFWDDKESKFRITDLSLTAQMGPEPDNTIRTRVELMNQPILRYY